MEPWVEAAAIFAGAREVCIHPIDTGTSIFLFHVVTVEYNSLTYNYSSSHSFIRTVSGSEFSAFYLNEVSSFDIALSVSSFDHDGLGRYGDPLDQAETSKPCERFFPFSSPAVCCSSRCQWGRT